MPQAGHAGSDVFSRQIAVPPPPARARYAAAPPGEQHSRVPPSDDDSVASLEYSDRQRLAKERGEAATLDRSHSKVPRRAHPATCRCRRAAAPRFCQGLLSLSSLFSGKLWRIGRLLAARPGVS